MPDTARDHLERYFAEKLWVLIPASFRDDDGLADPPGVLRGFIEVLARQAANLRRSTDQLWDDQFIDLCGEWAVPYIGELVGTRLVSALNRRARRVDVAKTIYYRRRKGTPRILEELIADITGWEGKVVEEFRRLGRFRHGLDPAPGPLAGRITQTPPGGWADLRSARGAELADGAFDEFHHTPDFRRPRGRAGRYGIARITFHLFRLAVTPLANVTPFSLGGDSFTFDPSGRNRQLFMRRYRTDPSQPTNWDEWVTANPWELPGPLSCRVLAETGARAVLLPGKSPGLEVDRASVWITAGGLVAAPEELVAANLAKPLGAAPASGLKWAIDPQLGRLQYVGAPALPAPLVSYHEGFSGPIGAGGYDRAATIGAAATATVRGGGGGLPGALGPLLAADVLEIGDSATYAGVTDLPKIVNLELRSANRQRPYIQLGQDWKLDTLTAVAGTATLTLAGWWIGSDGQTARSIDLAGDFATVTLQNVTLDPGGKNAANQSIGTVTLTVTGHVQRLIIDHSITGPIVIAPGATVENLEIRDSIVDDAGSSAAPPVILARDSQVTLRRVTVRGAVSVEWLYATDTLIAGRVRVTNPQEGCFRFSAALVHSRLPHPFESHLVPAATSWFTSMIFGEPGYGQLAEAAPIFLQRGAENGSEIGAFSSLLNPIKLDSLRAKVDEFAPFGLLPIYLFET